jgi:hypothetical protein
MKIIFHIVFSFLIVISCVGQDQNFHHAINLYGGRIAFGTGDFFGQSTSVEYLHQLTSDNKIVNHFKVGIELTFENGNSRPKIINPNYQEFIARTFYNTTNLILTPKVYYFPFTKTFLKGLNICIGFPIGYISKNREFRATYIYDSVTKTSIRRSYLAYTDKFIIGYKVSTGYDLIIFKQLVSGVRVDLCSYSNGDVNTVISGKVGFKFR